MKKINVAELLKDCPKGMELDCTMFDNVEFDSIVDNDYFPIRCRIKDSNDEYNFYNLTKHGYWNNDYKAKCVIFPKGKTTWEGFQIPFKDGDVITCENECCTFISIFKENTPKRDSFRGHYTFILDDSEFKVRDSISYFNKARFATKKEKYLLFKAINDSGYKWNEENKTLEKLVEPKFKVGDKANKAVFDANAQCCDIMNSLIKEESMEETIKIDIPKGYEFAGVDDDNQQVVFEKIVCRYPKTYEECCGILQVIHTEWHGYLGEVLVPFQKLLICRDAYWKIAGEQMDLGRPWNQDYDDRCFIIANNNGNIHTYEYHGTNNVILAFPTAEMRDAFYENFKELINETKELL